MNKQVHFSKWTSCYCDFGVKITALIYQSRTQIYHLFTHLILLEMWHHFYVIVSRCDIADIIFCHLLTLLWWVTWVMKTKCIFAGYISKDLGIMRQERVIPTKTGAWTHWKWFAVGSMKLIQLWHVMQAAVGWSATSSLTRQWYHFAADFHHLLLQLVDILDTLFNTLSGQLTLITEMFELF